MMAQALELVEFTIKAPGKAILFGEHAVVHGTKACASSINLYTTSSYQLLPERDAAELELPDLQVKQVFEMRETASILNECCPDGPNLNGIDARLLEHVLQRARRPQYSADQSAAIAAFEYLNVVLKFTDKHSRFLTKRGCRIVVSSQIPVGAGLGSSASYSACIAASLLLHYNHLDKDTDLRSTDSLNLINKYAFIAECVIHGNPSGIDNTVCVFGGVIAYQKAITTGKAETKVIDKFQHKFLLTNTKTPRQTKVQLLKFKQVIDGHNLVAKSMLETIDCISAEFESMIHAENVDYERMKTLININQKLLECFNVSHPNIAKVCDIAQKFGLASKLTGAGGGGCVLTLLPDTVEDSQLMFQLRDQLSCEGFEAFEVVLGVGGVKIEFK
ncbi:hypothetical protein MP228_007777 [Amoeboaphelidium protococcarum]|nr:hypothetical protein MP228_007777 [Amoeboaphelidium protococcarum]